MLLLPVRSARLGYQELQGTATTFSSTQPVFIFILLLVGTSGLEYPLLLCLGEKSFVVILNYVQRPDLCGPKALFAQQRSRTHPPGLERSGSITCSGRSRPSARTTRGSGPSVEVRTPAESRTPTGVRDPLNSNRTPHRGKESAPLPGGSGADTCLQAQTRIQGRLVSILSLTHHCIHCGRWTSALM